MMLHKNGLFTVENGKLKNKRTGKIITEPAMYMDTSSNIMWVNKFDTIKRHFIYQVNKHKRCESETGSLYFLTFNNFTIEQTCTLINMLYTFERWQIESLMNDNTKNIHDAIKAYQKIGL